MVTSDNGASIFDAAASGDLQMVTHLVTKGVDVNSKLNDGSTPLMKASANGNFNVVKFLVQKGANVNQTDKWGYTALLWAVDSHLAGLNVVSLLVEGKANVNVRSKEKGYSPLHWAALHGDLEIVKYLVEKGALVDEESKVGETPLHLAAVNNRLNVLRYLMDERGLKLDEFEAAEKGYTNVVKYFVERKRKSPNATDSSGCTVLHRAALGGNLETAKYLVEKAGADVNAGNAHRGTLATPLHAAAEKGHFEMVIYLVEKGANVNARDSHGRTALYRATQNGHSDLVTYFMDALNGARDDTENNGKSLLHAACWCDSVELVRYLVEEKHLNTNAQDNDGVTPLVECIQRGKLESFEYLLNQTVNSVDVELVDKSGNNVIHYAAGKGSLSAIKELVKKGVNYSLQNRDGETPLDFASKDGNLETIRYLIDDLHVNYSNQIFNAAEKGHLSLVKYLVEFKGANVSARDEEDRTPVFNAATGLGQSGGHLNILRYFLDEKKVDARQRDEKGYTLLHAAVMSGPLEVAKYLVEEKRLDVNAKDKDGFSVLFLSLHGHKFDIFKYLLNERNADFRSASPWGTCLHEAAVRGFLDFAKALVEKGADMNAKHDEGRTPVFYAADGKRLNTGGHLDVLRYFVDEKKANVFQKDNKGYTLLHAVSMSGPLEVAKYLVDEKGLDMNAKDKEGFTALFDAVWAGKYDIFQFLLDRKADVQIQTLWGTALHEAAAKGYLNFAKALVEKGADLTAKHDGNSPVFYAADGKRQGSGGHLDVLRYFLEERKADPHRRGGRGSTLLHAAVGSGPLDVVKYLVEQQGLDINAKDNEEFAVLFISLHFEKFDIFKYLLEERHANVESGSPWGTCLHEAAVRGFLDFAKALVENGADMNAKHDEGRTPVYYAADGKRLNTGGHLDVLRYFVDEKKANVFQKDNKGYTLLHAVSMSGPLEVAKYLVEEKGLDMNAKDNEGYTVLFDAVWANKYDIFEYLLEERNADFRSNTPAGTCLHEAAKRGFEDMVEKLVQKGADVNAKDKDGRTPAYYASSNDHQNVLKYLESKGGRSNRRRRNAPVDTEGTGATNSAGRHYSAVNDIAYCVQSVASHLLSSRVVGGDTNSVRLESDVDFSNGFLMLLGVVYSKVFGREFEWTSTAAHEALLSPAQLIERRVDHQAANAVRDLPDCFEEKC